MTTQVARSGKWFKLSNFLRLDTTPLCVTLASEVLGNLNKCIIIISFLLSMFSTSEYVLLANHNEAKNLVLSDQNIFPVGQNFIHIHSEQSY